MEDGRTEVMEIVGFVSHILGRGPAGVLSESGGTLRSSDVREGGEGPV